MQLCVCSRGKFEQAASCKPQTWYPRTSGHSHLLSPKTAQYPTIECWWFKEPHREACRPQTPICAGWWQCHNNDYSIVDVFFFFCCVALRLSICWVWVNMSSHFCRINVFTVETAKFMDLNPDTVGQTGCRKNDASWPNRLGTVFRGAYHLAPGHRMLTKGYGSDKIMKSFRDQHIWHGKQPDPDLNIVAALQPPDWGQADSPTRAMAMK